MDTIEIAYTAICRIVMLDQYNLDQYNLVLAIAFLNDIISDDKISVYSKIFIVDNTTPELMLVLKLFQLYVFNLWWFETLLCVFKPHLISYS